MFNRKYYCLIAGLPDLILRGDRQSLTSLQFKHELAVHLSTSDYQLLELLYRQTDNQNLLNLLLHQDLPFDHLGNYTEDYLKNQINEPTDIIEYMRKLITDVKSETVDRSTRYSENKLQELFYDYIRNTDNEFIKQWFSFDRDVKNLLTAVNCANFGYPPKIHLISDNKTDGLYEFLLSCPSKPGLPADENLPFLDQIFRVAQSDMDTSDKEKAIDHIRFSMLDELTFFYYFTIEKILSYTIKLSIIDRWLTLDNQAGYEFLEKLTQELKQSYSFVDEFCVITKK